MRETLLGDFSEVQDFYSMKDVDESLRYVLIIFIKEILKNERKILITIPY